MTILQMSKSKLGFSFKTRKNFSTRRKGKQGESAMPHACLKLHPKGFVVMTNVGNCDPNHIP
jgi:hypothetical protein